MFDRPNFTQVPNKLFDEMLPTLKEGELRVLMIVMRQTFGWGNKEWDRISLSQLMKKTGMERMAVCRAVKSLVQKGIMSKKKEGVRGSEQVSYSLIVQNPENLQDSIDDSNNSYQYPKNTPPSILKIPTKETLTKERREEKLPKGSQKKESASPPPPEESRYAGRFEEKIQISLKNYERLIEKFKSPELIEEYAERLFRYSFKNPARFKRYKRHDMVIEEWIEESLKKKKTEEKTSQAGSLIGLSEYHQTQLKTNLQLVEWLKSKYREKCKGLYVYHKDRIIRDPSKPNGETCDISATVFWEDVVRVMEKWYNIEIPVSVNH